MTTPGNARVALATLEEHLNNYLDGMELRIERRFNEQEQRFSEQLRWMVGLFVPLYALLVALILSIAFGGSYILNKMP